MSPFYTSDKFNNQEQNDFHSHSAADNYNSVRKYYNYNNYRKRVR